MYALGVDVGGTHTDLVLFDGRDGSVRVHKVPTDVADPARGTIAALLEMAAKEGVAPGAIAHFMHGTTVATNIALEHNGARTGLITTAGFRDVLHIARHKRPQTFSLQLDLPWQKWPLVPRRRRLTVPERIVPPGAVLVALDEAAVRAAVRRLVAEGVEAVAICFLHAYLNPAHELRAAEIVAGEAPGLFVSMSHAVVPQYREYERFSTTALNAYVGPKTARYLSRMAGALEAAGVPAPLRLMQSSGGAASLEAAVARPVNLLMSGPAAGLLGGIWVGRTAGFDSVIALDVGGTSADIGVAPGGQVLFKHLLDTRLGDYHAMVPMAEVDAIGAGGGSIAYVDGGGQFQVGPRSAGADPGPASYGHGGREPTATDCLLVLGRLDPDGFLGGRRRLYPDLARAAIEAGLARPLGMTVEEAALGALRILTHNMVQACEVGSVRKGLDPRDFALVAFGGGGPLFACDIARELGIPHVVIPPAPGLTSALGLLASDVSYELGQTVMAGGTGEADERLAPVLDRLEATLAAELARDGFSGVGVRLVRSADCRYAGQGYELRTPLPDGPVDAAFRAAARAAFDREHERQYGRAFPERPFQIVTVRVTGIAATARLAPPTVDAAAGPDPAPALRTVAPVLFEAGGGPVALPTPRYARATLRAGHRLTGPAIVDQMDATTVIPPGWSGLVDGAGNIVLSPREDPR